MKAGFLNFDDFLFEISSFTIIDFWSRILAAKFILSIEVSRVAILLNP